MPSKAHLIQRNGRWYFNRRFPKELWPITGSNPFRLALQTDSLQLAIRARPDAERRFWVVADEARKKLGETQPRALSEVEAVAIVSRWFVERNAELDSDHLHDPEPAEIMQEVIDGTVYVIGDDSRRLAASDLEGYGQLAETVLSEAGVKADPESKGYRALLQLLVRANKELALIDLARLRGDFGYKPSDPVFVQALAAPERPARTISQLIEAYTDDRGTKRNWSPSTKAAYEPVWRLLKDTLGSSRDVATITRDDGRLLFETVKSLPRNLGKIKALDAQLPA
jgi:hypothetical protein